MQLGRVVGNAVSTIKHPSFQGWRLLLVQPLTQGGKEDGDPVLAFDQLGARGNDKVIISSDGKGTRQMVGARNTPARWMTMGICD